MDTYEAFIPSLACAGAVPGLVGCGGAGRNGRPAGGRICPGRLYLLRRHRQGDDQLPEDLGGGRRGHGHAGVLQRELSQADRGRRGIHRHPRGQDLHIRHSRPGERGHDRGGHHHRHVDAPRRGIRDSHLGGADPAGGFPSGRGRSARDRSALRRPGGPGPGLAGADLAIGDAVEVRPRIRRGLL